MDDDRIETLVGEFGELVAQLSHLDAMVEYTARRRRVVVAELYAELGSQRKVAAHLGISGARIQQLLAEEIDDNSEGSKAGTRVRGGNRLAKAPSKGTGPLLSEA